MKHIANYKRKRRIKSSLKSAVSSHKKKTNPIIGNNLDGARGYYAQSNRPVGEIHVPNDLTHVWSTITKKN